MAFDRAASKNSAKSKKQTKKAIPNLGKVFLHNPITANPHTLNLVGCIYFVIFNSIPFHKLIIIQSE
ncbi:hypothetical protein AZF00_17755 [Zhongshania aliphaticivorans]|uniref:Uncharacterized protein n=1 Tax=Zhongshania aliphaticivorans TaxID=1470434 RepID=A0A127M9V4_9GAMM|nr:hypothetical protein AZF00_17755 [Zhongshania aliphaticivorans]